MNMAVVPQVPSPLLRPGTTLPQPLRSWASGKSTCTFRQVMQKYLEVACTKLSKMTSLLLLIINSYGEGFSEQYAYRRSPESSPSHFALTRKRKRDRPTCSGCLHILCIMLSVRHMCIYPSMPAVREDTVDPCSSRLSRIV